MTKKGKVGKQRRDRFYKLAKETGFRSRASFKLLQLNRKFEFLPKSRVLIDLCAAPGGWLQVAQQAMPVSSIIIGVDIVPIRALPNVITLQEDITTDRCRQSLKRELKTWKADVILNDGAPNVGQNWVQDAFTQNTLTLSALKLATDMLAKGGWFITKVFRSKDYLNLVWVFKKLFKRVHITKPQASRNESAEIFIICQGYLAPDRLDPKFVDPSHIFKTVQSNSEFKVDIMHKSKKKPKAEGYEEDAPIYSTLKASEFILCDNFVERLGKCQELIFDDEDIKNHNFTTEEVKQCAQDIKVLGKADLKLLLNWRKKMREVIKGPEEEKEKSTDDQEKGEMEEIDEALQAAEEMELAKLKQARKQKKKILHQRKKILDRLNLKMIIKDDVPMIEDDQELFNLKRIKNSKDLKLVEEENDLQFPELPDPDWDIVPIKRRKSAHVTYDRHDEPDDMQAKVIEEEEKEESLYSSDDGLSSDLEFESDSQQSEDEEVVKEQILEGKKNPLQVDLLERPDQVEYTVDRWFDNEEFADDEPDSDLELDLLAETYEKKKKSKSAGNLSSEAADENKDVSADNLSSAAVAEKMDVDADDLSSESEDENEDLGDVAQGSSGKNENERPLDNETLKRKEERKKRKKEAKERKKELKRAKRVRLDAEGMALGSLLVQSRKMKRDIVENAYNRYAFNDEHLPSWFVQDEKKHYRKQLPVTKEMVDEYKQHLREINTRPLKKVVEAKARKKRRANNRLAKAKKRAEKVTDHPDMSAREKADHLKQIYKKAMVKETPNIHYVVAKKRNKGRAARPPGVKGRYRMVDKRLKKDTRGEMKGKKKQKGLKQQMKQKQQQQKKSKKRRK